MAQSLLMGNQAIALGALRAGVGLCSGYPGTPSTEVLETISKNRRGIYVEWSVNEKAALEVAAGAAYTGTRTLVTMKQVGLNVASDPLMSLGYIGVKGGMVVLVADDPGPISSQTEQDTRTFARYAKIPCFDPSSPEEAYEMIGDAFDYSEKYATPVLFRPTTRLCHACASIDTDDFVKQISPEGFKKDPKWVIFPRLSYAAHLNIEKRNPQIGEDFSTYRFNTRTGAGKKGVAAGGVSHAYVKEALKILGGDCRLLKVGTPFPFPETLAYEFLDGLEEVLVIEELDPVIERELVYLCGKKGIRLTVKGKLTGHVQAAGENTVESVVRQLSEFLNIPYEKTAAASLPQLPVRPPVLCAGCPHRASFYAVKQAMKGKKALFSGDIGCYTLGNAQPLDMVDTCLCMGAGITLAQGIRRAEPDTACFAFVGDSTFFASGITGIVNAVYNNTDMILVVLDNSTTAMTGHQPHPGTGRTLMGDAAGKLSIPDILKAIGVKNVQIADPLDLTAAIAAAKKAADDGGVQAIIYKSPCIYVTESEKTADVEPDQCIGCQRCIQELGCPALVTEGGKAAIDKSLCTGCLICAHICPTGAIKGGRRS
ncbi:indolepyruvate ferredoxin oxidoreductase alpha subunit [Sporobacter termitidis DSM 10068]|uniref:Indolepyruvate oxidoreductase subunit IorA n=1 Tax=Sporobacter termitidis DSM 10068 TaxID=1123282 RepID=A0A1M5TE32_9FIRM|nr:indolepyruvate ferredoxin oxidoreductase subunit alpha [Sporobacter termitidis]SHH48968.1 indolepyruvate ferredoxin oxidoreductase alpha subunit [Sporobacter termitidis DSM 10068]